MKKAIFLFFLLLMSPLISKAQCPAGQTSISLEINHIEFGGEIGWELVDATTGTIIACAPTGTYSTSTTPTVEGPFCVTDGNDIQVIGYDNFGDGWNNSFFNVIIAEDGSTNGCTMQAGCVALANAGANINSADPDVMYSCNATAEAMEFTISLPSFACDATPIMGCDNPLANNYNICATMDDGSCEIPPANNECAGAIPVTVGSTTAGTTELSNNVIPAGNDGSCDAGGFNNGVWYSIVGDGDDFTASVCDAASYDTRISVFSGSCAALVCVAGNDDGAGCGGFTSEVGFCTTPGETYFVYVHAFGTTTTGTFDLSMSSAPPAAAPVNDLCVDAEALVPTVDPAPLTPVAGNTIGALSDDLDCLNEDKNVWYAAPVSAEGFLDIAVTGGTLDDPRVIVYFGACGALVEVATDVDCGGNAAISINDAALAGQTLLISVEDGTANPDGCTSFSGDAPGDFTITVSQPLAGCTDPCFTEFDPAATVNDGSCATTISVPTACDDGNVCTINDVEVLDASGGVCIPCAGTPDPAVAPVNALCDAAIPVAVGDVVTGNTECGVLDANVLAIGFCGTTPAANGIWYSLEGTGETISLSLCNSAFDTRINVYTGGCGSTELTCLDGNDDSGAICGPGFRSYIEIPTTVGETYFIFVNGFNGSTGDIELAVNCVYADGECVDVDRVCAGNALYIAECGTAGFTFTWTNTTTGTDYVVNDTPYFEPTETGTYSLSFTNGTATLTGCNTVDVKEIIDCNGCGVNE